MTHNHRVSHLFRSSCRYWHDLRATHNQPGRKEAYEALIQRYGVESVLRHQQAIKTALDGIEGRERDA